MEPTTPTPGVSTSSQPGASRIEAVTSRAAATAHEAVDRMAGAVQSSAEQLSTLQDRWTATSRECVRNHPLTSVGVAFLAGLVIARMAHR